MSTRNSVATHAATAPASTETFVIDSDHSEIGFSIRHLLSRSRGRFARFSGQVNLDRLQPERSSVVLEVDASSIDTRQTDRDTHLRSAEFFDVESYPMVRFASHRMTRVDGTLFRVEGTLELHGVKRPMELEVSYFGIARDPWGVERAGFATEAIIDRKEFGMHWNAVLDNGGLVLGNDVKLTIDLEAMRKA